MRPYSDPALEKTLLSHAKAKGFNAWLDVQLVAAGNGQIELEINTRDEMLQHHGYIHGGVVGALADTACAWAAASVAGDVVTASYTIQLLAPAMPPKLVAKACVIKQGKRNVSVEAKIYSNRDNGEEQLVANALASIAVLGELKTNRD